MGLLVAYIISLILDSLEIFVNQYKRIFLVGHHGAGKAIVAQALASKLGWKFVDADLGLESKLGQHVVDLAGKEFLNTLLQVTSQQLQLENVVITTDPGIVLNDKILDELSSELVVYVQVSLHIQIERTAHQANTLLPLDNKEEFFNRLHIERDHLYENMANIVINADDSAVENHVASILKYMQAETASKTIELEPQEKIFFHHTKHIPIQLTSQQAFCLQLLASGKAAKVIAQEMGISYRTVEGNIAKMLELLGCHSSKELIAVYHTKP